jgi:hypothetical protein
VTRKEALRRLLVNHSGHIIGLVFAVVMLSVGICLCTTLRNVDAGGRVGVWTVRGEWPEPVRAGYHRETVDEYRRERRISGLICIAVGVLAGLWTFVAATDYVREREAKPEEDAA